MWRHRFLLFRDTLIAGSNVIDQCSNLLAAYSSTSLPSGRTFTNNRGALFSVWNSSYVAAASSKIVSTSRLLSRGRIRNRSTRCKIRKQDTISDSRGVNSPVVRPVCRLRDAPRLDRPPTDVILFMRESLCTIGERRGSDYAETAVDACFANIFPPFRNCREKRSNPLGFQSFVTRRSRFKIQVHAHCWFKNRWFRRN